MSVVTKRVADLEPGDVCCGPGVFVLTGTVESVATLRSDPAGWTGDHGELVQIRWVGGTYTHRSPDDEVLVRKDD